jgi:hypothetical protein
MNIRNHAPTIILRTLWEKPGHKRCEPVPAIDRSCTHPWIEVVPTLGIEVVPTPSPP